ncbi:MULTISPECIES: penicillin-binding protein 2 [Desulfovibrio]|uniref:Penicillin-binding protein 2 n=3 Tax=Desulfovibrio TaxID=872 RepID=A0AA94HUU8_DESDE|nr:MULTISPECIES: penicillin-binding protein 2 [Desulfovibrio]ATD80142.1 penicillin-binding protein 2 [Desulfovibrio sp. G11]SFW69084.1 penicillin-binding protein 2 [Desulfovibrio desulfuricans]SPD35597.1 Penicillin binding protein, transpeptidase [Desulfovibrio sp. G11]
MLRKIKKNSLLGAKDKNARKGIRSWLKIQVEGERYQPPRGGIILLQILVGLLFFVLVVRFWYLQMHRGAEFAQQAQNNRLRIERIFAPRGRIMDDQGKVLADNRTAYGLSLVREDCPDIPATLAQISAWSGIPLPQIWEKFRQDRFKVKSFEPLLMITDIDFDLVARIESEIHAWPGLEIVVRTKRSYPEKDLFAHVLGYVAEANEQEMAADSALAMGDLVGKQGLELELEKQLRGRKGLYDVEVDAHSRVLGKFLREEPRGGKEIRLSLDRDLQEAAWNALGGEAGCVVVMEPDTGKLRALVTSPAYDNNLFAAGISQRDWDALRTNSRFPLQNRVIQSVYPPGSVWKLVIAAMLLERGVNPRESVFCPGQVKLGNQIFRCWKRGGHGSQDMQSALVNSCDVYFYQMGERMGIDKIEEFAKASGFGRPTGIDLPHEKSGLVPSKEWKKRRFGRPWVRGETYNVSIGQGYTLVTPVQMAVFVSALLNGGNLLKPQLLDDAQREIKGNIPAKAATLNFVVEAMRKTATGGTARIVNRKDADMGGKTGTAQVVKLKMAAGDRRLRTHEMEYAQRDHAWITTWGVKDGKAYVVVVMVEHGGGGSSVAGPVAKKVYEHLFGPDPGSPAAPAPVPAPASPGERTD